MAAMPLEDRVAVLEREVARLKLCIPEAPGTQPWWERILGVFEDDPVFDEAMRLGQKHRESPRPTESGSGGKHGVSA